MREDQSPPPPYQRGLKTLAEAKDETGRTWVAEIYSDEAVDHWRERNRPTFRAFAGRSVVIAVVLWVVLWVLLKIADFLPFI